MFISIWTFSHNEGDGKKNLVWFLSDNTLDVMLYQNTIY